MKQGNAINRIIMLVLLGAVVLYLAVSAWNSLTDPFSTVVSYAYTVDDAVECTGFVVREETVLAGTGGIVDLLPEEGEKVAQGRDGGPGLSERGGPGPQAADPGPDAGAGTAPVRPGPIRRRGGYPPSSASRSSAPSWRCAPRWQPGT